MKYDNFGFRTHTGNPHSDSFLTVYEGGGGFMRGDLHGDLNEMIRFPLWGYKGLK